MAALTSTFTAAVAISSAAMAGEAEAKALLKAMTNYVTAQKAISFDYDVNFDEVASGRSQR